MLENVPRFLSSISVSGEHIIHHEVALDSANLSDEVTLVVEREARFRVEVADDITLPLDMVGRDSEGSKDKRPA